jgi:glycosyltransferase involved in cell wall biosynthesis
VLSKVFHLLRYEGFSSVVWRANKWLMLRSKSFVDKPLSTVFNEDVVSVDWTKPREFIAQKPLKPQGKPQIAWVISPPGPSSGGHQNAYMFMQFLEKAGYEITIFLYSAGKYPKVSIEGVKWMLARNSGYPSLFALYRVYDPSKGITGDFDAIVCSDWATAYAAWRYERDIPRIYWVLDFEPAFFPAGPDYIVAENSYRLGYKGITIGPWLAEKLTRDYNMPTDFYEYAVDSFRYSRTNDSRRNEILFYARPTTPRRGTEFGLLVLEEVHRRRPDITINIAGWDMSHAGINFPFINHGSMQVSELPHLYNKCAAALVLSLTCMSLLPLEVMACGVVPIVNDGENTRVTLRDDPRIEFVPLSPALMAEKLIEAVDRKDQIAYSRKLAQSAQGQSWDEAGQRVVGLFDQAIKRR